jgi:N-ethylmaleimide reductase
MRPNHNASTGTGAMTRDASILLSPFRLGDLQLNNRLVMAPLTRNRATKGTDAPKRAMAGLIVSEATQISQQGQGYIWTPGIYTEARLGRK